MSFAISNIIYAYQGVLENNLSNKSNAVTGLLDFALVASVSTIGGLMLSGLLTFGLPMGIGSVGNYLAWGGIGLGGGIAIVDILAAIAIKCSTAPSLPEAEKPLMKKEAHLKTKSPANRPKPVISLSLAQTQVWLRENRKLREQGG